MNKANEHLKEASDQIDGVINSIGEAAKLRKGFPTEVFTESLLLMAKDLRRSIEIRIEREDREESKNNWK